MNTRANRVVMFFTAACAQVINVVRKRAFPFLVLSDLCFFALSLSPGHNPAQEEMCLSVGKRSISVPYAEEGLRSIPRPLHPFSVRERLSYGAHCPR